MREPTLHQKSRNSGTKTVSHKPDCVSNDSSDDPESRALQENLFDAGASCACGVRRASRAIRQCAVDDDSLGTIDRTNIHKTAVPVRSAAVPQKRADISCIAIVIAPAGIILLAETSDGQSLVDAVRVAGVGICAIHEAIRMRVWIGVGTVKPETRKDAKSCTTEEIWCNTQR